MQAVIRKWGNSPALRLPVSALKEAAFSLEQMVNLTVTRGRIVIEPSGRVEYDLAELVGGITARNSHGEVSFGKPVGKLLPQINFRPCPTKGRKSRLLPVARLAPAAIAADATMASTRKRRRRPTALKSRAA